jgi:hypothetical protein
MLTSKQAGEMAALLPGVTLKDHFGGDAYRTDGGIFATVWHATRSVNLKLTLEQQQRFLAIDGEGFVEIDNAWGRQGWTTANLEFLDCEDFQAALQAAWENSANKPKRGKRKASSRKAQPSRRAAGRRRAARGTEKP